MSAIFIDCPPHEAGFLTPELRDIVPGLAVNTGAPPLHALLYPQRQLSRMLSEGHRTKC